MKHEVKDTATRIAEEILKCLDKGVSPWHQPWAGGMAPMSVNGRRYRGINIILLALAGINYSSPYWTTFRKAKELGGSVRKGQRGTLVMFWQRVEKVLQDKSGKPVLDADGKPKMRSFMVIRGYTVFNAEQCDGLPEKFYPKPERRKKVDRNKAAEALWKKYTNAPKVKHGGTSACYIPSLDVIHLPKQEAFDSTDEYWSTRFHEGCHSTGHESRLNRDLKNGFGTEDYGKEELIAEIGSQVLCQSCGITRTLKNSAAYCKGWAQAIRSMPDKERAIICAASAAQRAADYIMGVKYDKEGGDANA